MKEETTFICKCGKHFNTGRSLQSHESQCKVYKQWKLLHNQELLQQKEAKRLSNGMFKCENPDCNKEHDGSYGSGRFCCNECKAHYNSKIGAQTAKLHGTRKCNFLSQNNIHNRAPFGRWKCECCNLIFETRKKLCEHNHQYHSMKKRRAWNKGLTKNDDLRIANSAIKTSETLKRGYANKTIVSPAQTSDFWTKERREIQKQNAIKRQLGGYHKNGGKGKRGRYKGIWCDSSWELALVIYWFDHNISFSRCKEHFEYIFDGGVHTYNPDFVFPNGLYIEVKGWKDIKWQAKINQFPKDKKLQVIDKNDIQYILIMLYQNMEKILLKCMINDFHADRESDLVRLMLQRQLDSGCSMLTCLQ